MLSIVVLADQASLYVHCTQRQEIVLSFVSDCTRPKPQDKDGTRPSTTVVLVA